MDAEPLLTVASGSTAVLETSLFGDNSIPAPNGIWQSVVQVDGGAALEIRASTFADEGLVNYEVLSAGTINDSIFWSASNMATLDAPMFQLEGNCNVGDAAGALVEVLGGPPNLANVNPEYQDPLGISGFANFRLLYTTPVRDLCDDPATLDLDGFPRATNFGAEPGAFEIPEAF